MQKVFAEYNKLEKAQFESLWKDAIFVFDTNVLLNLYRYSNDTSKRFLETITKLTTRVWLPYQVGLEYNKNRLQVISDQKKHYQDFEKKFNELVKEIQNKNRNPFLSNNLAQTFVSANDLLKGEVQVKIAEYDSHILDDGILDQINAIFDGRVGQEFTSEDVKKIQSEGERRYKDKIPPGYCDIKKPDGEKYGDLIIWKQMLAKAKTDNLDIIFIIDDRKDDWWFEHEGRTISARPELIKEFKAETSRICHFYKPFQFLEYSNEFLGTKIEQTIIQEVKDYVAEQPDGPNFIQIEFTLEGQFDDLTQLVNDIKSTGYKTYTDFDILQNVHLLTVILPNIPDLERRFSSKYLINLEKRNLKIINKNIESIII